MPLGHFLGTSSDTRHSVTRAILVYGRLSIMPGEVADGLAISGRIDRALPLAAWKFRFGIRHMLDLFHLRKIHDFINAVSDMIDMHNISWKYDEYRRLVLGWHIDVLLEQTWRRHVAIIAAGARQSWKRCRHFVTHARFIYGWRHFDLTRPFNFAS